MPEPTLKSKVRDFGEVFTEKGSFETGVRVEKQMRRTGGRGSKCPLAGRSGWPLSQSPRSTSLVVRKPDRQRQTDVSARWENRHSDSTSSAVPAKTSWKGSGERHKGQPRESILQGVCRAVIDIKVASRNCLDIVGEYIRVWGWDIEGP